MSSLIQQARYIDVSISEFQKHAFEKFLALVMFLDISFTILMLTMLTEVTPKWKLKKAYNPGGAGSEVWNRVYMIAPVKKFGRVRLSTNFL